MRLDAYLAEYWPEYSRSVWQKYIAAGYVMVNEQVETTEKAKRVHDQAPSDQFAAFMASGWAPSDYDDLEPLEVVTYAFARRQVLSAAYPGVRLVLPAGGYKVRSNDTDYQYRPHSAFAYYSGVQGADSTADAVLVMEPTQGGHLTYLYIHPRSTRDTDAFYRDAKYGELLGAHMIGMNVTEMIAEIVVAKRLETTGHEMLKAIHPHPTMSEAVMEATAAAYGEVIHL